MKEAPRGNRMTQVKAMITPESHSKPHGYSNILAEVKRKPIKREQGYESE